jgi:hypothetical protein
MIKYFVTYSLQMFSEGIVLKERANCVANFVLNSFMLQQLVLIPFKFQMFSENFVHCCV